MRCSAFSADSSGWYLISLSHERALCLIPSHPPGTDDDALQHLLLLLLRRELLYCHSYVRQNVLLRPWYCVLLLPGK